MNLIEKLIDYKKSFIIIEKNNEKIKIKINKEVLSDSIKKDLKDNKKRILDFYQVHGISSNQQLAPSSFSQQRLWFLEQLEVNVNNYNILECLYIPECVDISALKKSLLSIVTRHQSLRTTFLEKDGVVYQKINSVTEVPLHIDSISTLTKEEFVASVEDTIANCEKQCFDLEKDLMIKAWLCENGEQGGYLVINIHHIVSDGWSQLILKKELKELYQKYKTNQEAVLPQLTLQFADYAHWERSFFKGDVLKKHLDFWSNTLQDLPEIHSLPLDKPRPAIQTFNGNTYTADLEGDFLLQFRSICNSLNMSVYMGLSAVFSYFLSRYSGEDDIVFASPVANREQPELAPVIGYFVNTIILRFNLSSVNNFYDLLELSKNTCMNAFAHQQVPFEQVVNQLKLKRSASYSPAFQIMFSLAQDSGSMGSDNGPDSASLSPLIKYTKSKFDLSLTCEVTDKKIRLHWCYNTDLFTLTTIKLMVKTFENLILQLVNKPKEKLSSHALQDIDFIGGSYGLGDAAPNSKQLLVHHLLEGQAKEHPNDYATQFKGKFNTFDELNRMSNQLANYIKSRRPLDNEAVIVYMDSTDMLAVAIFATLKAKGYFITIDKRQPKERITQIISQVDAKVIVTDEKLEDTFASMIDVIDLSDCATEIKVRQQADENLDLEYSPSDIAYMSFTSGTTGLPKGVMISHENLLSYLVASNEYYKIKAGDKLLQFSSLSFDIFIEEFFGSICNGALLQFRGAVEKTDIAQLMDFVSEHKTSVLSIPTAYYHTLCDNIEEISNYDFDSIRLIIVGGEKLSAEMVVKWKKSLLKHVQVLNTYGPTETTVVCSIYDLNNFPLEGGEVPIGKPLSGLSCCVVDRFGHVCPSGVKGELYVAGNSVSLGYHNSPELNSEKFVLLNPFNDKIFYRTGDLVRYIADGNLEYLGRVDDQIKIQGFRVELAEIEYQINRLNYVTSSLVLVKGSDANKRLVAYIKPKALVNLESYSKEQMLHDFREQLIKTLPDYMLPSEFILVKTWPLTVNGKVDKKMLPEPDWSLLQSDHVAPTTQTEKRLTDIWSALLGIPYDNLSINSNFFELGGHSLLAIQLATKIKESLGYKIDLKEIFLHQNISRLSQLIDGNTGQIDANDLLLEVGGILDCRPTLFCIPGVAGLAKDFALFAKVANEFNFNVKAFNHRGVIDANQPYHTVFENADDFADEILKAQPEGPYFILGHSFGGVIALEVVKRLMSHKKKAKLFLLDTFFEQNTNNYSDSLSTNHHESSFEKQKRIVDIEDEHVDFKNRIAAVYSHQLRLLLEYKPEDNFTIDAVFMFAKKTPFNTGSYVNYLNEVFLTSSRCFKVEGDHFSMLKKLGASQIIKIISDFKNKYNLSE